MCFSVLGECLIQRLGAALQSPPPFAPVISIAKLIHSDREKCATMHSNCTVLCHGDTSSTGLSGSIGTLQQCWGLSTLGPFGLRQCKGCSSPQWKTHQLGSFFISLLLVRVVSLILIVCSSKALWGSGHRAGRLARVSAACARGAGSEARHFGVGARCILAISRLQLLHNLLRRNKKLHSFLTIHNGGASWTGRSPTSNIYTRMLGR